MKRKESNHKILIVVSGGVVQNIYSSDINTKIDLLDFDNEKFESGDKANRELNARKEDLVEIII